MRSNRGPEPIRRAWLLIVVAVCLGLAAPAHAQDPGNDPTAKELWRTYPLNEGGRTPPTPSVTPVRTAAAQHTTPAPAAATRDEGSSWSAPLVALIVLVGLAAAGVWTAVLLRRRRAGPSAPAPPKAQPVGTPPDPARPWTAEIGWSDDKAGPRFVVVASGPDGLLAPVAGSGVLEWPPQGPDGVQALSRAADDLERTLLAVGWTPLPPGSAWYAKRFEWHPVAPEKARRAGRGARAARGSAAAPPKPSATPAARKGKGAPPATRTGGSGRFTPSRGRGQGGSSGTAPAAVRGASSARAAAATATPREAAPATSRQAAAQAGQAAPSKPARSAPAEPRRKTAAAPGGPAPAKTAAPRRATPWPEDAHALWRCEIHWDAGYLTSRFEAVAYPPNEERGRTIARSEAFKWMLMALPDPREARQRAAARTLARAVRDAGWEVVGRGAGWYAERYVWRRDGEPPDHVDITPHQEETG